MDTISDLEITLNSLFNWFSYNNFKANASKYHLLLSLFNAKFINIKNSAIEDSSSDYNKAIGINSIPVKILKLAKEQFAEHLCFILQQVFFQTV